jgi:hypothetical protein
MKIFKIPIFFFLKKEKEKNCKDLGVSPNLTEFAKILIPESLEILINSFWEFWWDLTKKFNGRMKLKRIERWIS